MLRASEDRSVRAEGNADKGVYTLTFHTRLPGITGLRLETLPVEELTGGGPGLPENGNFVVTEFEVLAAPPPHRPSGRPWPLDRPAADFTQAGFDIQQAIDGVAQDQRGWAVHPAGGTVHWATFQTQATPRRWSRHGPASAHPPVPRRERPSPGAVAHLGHERTGAGRLEPARVAGLRAGDRGRHNGPRPTGNWCSNTSAAAIPIIRNCRPTWPRHSSQCPSIQVSSNAEHSSNNSVNQFTTTRRWFNCGRCAAQRRATQEQAIDCRTRSRLGADQ